jgi:hypothetical protein
MMVMEVGQWHTLQMSEKTVPHVTDDALSRGQHEIGVPVMEHTTDTIDQKNNNGEKEELGRITLHEELLVNWFI